MRRLFVVEACRVLDSRSVKIGTRLIRLFSQKLGILIKDRKTVEGQALSDGGGREIFHVMQT